LKRQLTILGDAGKKKDRVIQKYLWLLKYHNHTVGQLKQFVELQNVNPNGDAFKEEFEGSKVDELFISDELLTYKKK